MRRKQVQQSRPQRRGARGGGAGNPPASGGPDQPGQCGSRTNGEAVRALGCDRGCCRRCFGEGRGRPRRPGSWRQLVHGGRPAGARESGPAHATGLRAHAPPHTHRCTHTLHTHPAHTPCTHTPHTHPCTHTPHTHPCTHTLHTHPAHTPCTNTLRAHSCTHRTHTPLHVHPTHTPCTHSHTHTLYTHTTCVCAECSLPMPPALCEAT